MCVARYSSLSVLDLYRHFPPPSTRDERTLLGHGGLDGVHLDTLSHHHVGVAGFNLLLPAQEGYSQTFTHRSH